MKKDSINEIIEKRIKLLSKEDIVPLCFCCNKPMKHFIPSKGKFAGQKQEYEFVCDCKNFPKGLVLCYG